MVDHDEGDVVGEIVGVAGCFDDGLRGGVGIEAVRAARGQSPSDPGDAVADDVANDDCRPVIIDGDHVVLIAAEAGSGAGRPVADRDVEPDPVGEAREQMVLQFGDEGGLEVRGPGSGNGSCGELSDGTQLIE